MTDVLFYGDTQSSAAMRHELPVSIGDPFLLAIVGGRLHPLIRGANQAARAYVARIAPVLAVWASTRRSGLSNPS
jgi:hypothetical protein